MYIINNFKRNSLNKMITLNWAVERDGKDSGEMNDCRLLLQALRMARMLRMHAYPPCSLWDREERGEAGPATPRCLQTRSWGAELRDGESTVENTGKEAAQSQWEKLREHKRNQSTSNGVQWHTSLKPP